MQRFDLKQFRRQAAGTQVMELLDFTSMVHWGGRPNRQSPARGGSGPQSLTLRHEKPGKGERDVEEDILETFHRNLAGSKPVR